jgi:hypothetical protein
MQELTTDQLKYLNATVSVAHKAVQNVEGNDFQGVAELLRFPVETDVPTEAHLSIASCLHLFQTMSKVVRWFGRMQLTVDVAAVGQEKAELAVREVSESTFEILLYIYRVDPEARIPPDVALLLVQTSLQPNQPANAGELSLTSSLSSTSGSGRATARKKGDVHLSDEERALRIEWLGHIPHRDQFFSTGVLEIVAQRLTLTSYWVLHENRTPLRLALIKWICKVVLEASANMPPGQTDDDIVSALMSSRLLEACVDLLGTPRGMSRPRLPQGFELEELDFLCIGSSQAIADLRFVYNSDRSDDAHYGDKDRGKVLQSLCILFKRFGPAMIWKHLNPICGKLFEKLTKLGLDRVPAEFWPFLDDLPNFYNLAKVPWRDSFVEFCICASAHPEAGLSDETLRFMLTKCDRGVKQRDLDRVDQAAGVYEEFENWRGNVAAAIVCLAARSNGKIELDAVRWTDVVKLTETSASFGKDFGALIEQTKRLKDCFHWFELFRDFFPPCVRSRISEYAHHQCFLSTVARDQPMSSAVLRSLRMRFGNAGCDYSSFLQTLHRAIGTCTGTIPLSIGTQFSDPKLAGTYRRRVLEYIHAELFLFDEHQSSSAGATTTVGFRLLTDAELHSLLERLDMAVQNGLYDVLWYSSLDATMSETEALQVPDVAEVVVVKGCIVGWPSESSERLMLVRMFGRWGLWMGSEKPEPQLKEFFSLHRRKMLR